MSDWEDFCDSRDWNIGSEADYDQFLDSLEDEPRRTSFKPESPPVSKVIFYQPSKKPNNGLKII